jgi:adenosine deaminase/adenosine deaminase CECR1
MKQFLISSFSLLSAALLTSAATVNNVKGNESAAAQYYQNAKAQNDNAKLTFFFSQMPKGGDIHHHYSGAIYSETYLDWAQSKGLFINTQSFKLDTQKTAPFISIDSLKKNDQLYRSVLQTWSDLDFYNHFQTQDAPDRHFFNTFNYFGSVSNAYINAGLRQLKKRAVLENIDYIETMLASPSYTEHFSFNAAGLMEAAQSASDSLALIKVLDSCVNVIKKDPNYSTALQSYIDSLYSYHKGIDDSLFIMRFQTYTSRNSQPDVVFTRLFMAFNAVEKDSSRLITGINIVGPENGLTAMHDYWLHMQMFSYLKNKFPSIKTSMHAGELRMGMVLPEDLTYHIDQAVNIANANRIGHGVDIVYEKNAPLLLKMMKDKKIPVEINLTSNEFILGIKGSDHPINLYVTSGVPIVISTDDEGVSRNNLTDEYVKLGGRYNFSYQQIKSFVYNSIIYSFLSQADIDRCKKILDKKFARFESLIADMRVSSKKK